MKKTLQQNEIDMCFTSMFGTDNSNVDKISFGYGYSKLRDINFAESQNDDQRVYNRVVKDIFHLMDMIKPYKRHGLYKEFTRKFSDSLFTIDEDDKKNVESVLLENGQTWDNEMKYERNWLWERVKRKVASPDTLVPTLKSLFLSLGPLKCSKSGRTLFDKEFWKQTQSVLNVVLRGHASDPPDIQLYFKMGKDKYGLHVIFEDTCVSPLCSLKNLCLKSIVMQNK